VLTAKAQEILSFAEAHSLFEHPDFQPLSLFPKDMTFPFSRESTSYYSEWSPSAEQHHDPMHSLPISLQGNVGNRQHFPMSGMGFPPNYQGHNPRPVGFDIPVQIPGDNQDQSEHPKKRPSDKPAIVVPIGDFQKWNANFDKLKSVYEDGANIAKLPHNHVMRIWVSKQRKKYWAAVSKGLAMGNRSEPMYPNVITSCTYLPLTQDQVDALEALGMEWDPRRADFEVRLAAIKDYKERKGSLKGLYKEHKALYQWLFDQKERYLKKRSNAGLPEKDANCLRELGFNIPVQAPDGRHHRSEHPKNILAINVP
jgi:hypothetical protein